jgi:hypothetical protein
MWCGTCGLLQVPREVVAQWLTYLRNEFPVIAFKSSTQNQATHLKQHHAKAVGGHSSGAGACFGAPTMLALLGNYCRNLNIRTAIRVGVVGYPNVGKSSLINSLKRARVCGVGATPGFTKQCQEISLDKHVKLIDSPGIVFDGSGDVLRNCVKIETLADPITPVESILARCDPAQIMERYMVPVGEPSLSWGLCCCVVCCLLIEPACWIGSCHPSGGIASPFGGSCHPSGGIVSPFGGSCHPSGGSCHPSRERRWRAAVLKRSSCNLAALSR